MEVVCYMHQLEIRRKKKQTSVQIHFYFCSICKYLLSSYFYSKNEKTNFYGIQSMPFQSFLNDFVSPESKCFLPPLTNENIFSMSD